MGRRLRNGAPGELWLKLPPIVLWIWYRGDFFCGFQGQGSLPTVQRALAEALLAIGVFSTPVAASRTDKGVHARMQVVRIRGSSFSAPELLARLTSRLPPGLGVCTASLSARSFHPQWSSAGKDYRYRLCLLGNSCSDWEGFIWRPADHPRLAGRKLEASKLAELLAHAVGTHDFIAFHEKSSPRRLRTLRAAELAERSPGRLEIRLAGDSFGRYQARYLVGSAVAAAAGEIPAEQYRAALQGGIPFPGLKAPAQGLILWEVLYPPEVDPFPALQRQRAPNLPSKAPFEPW